MGDMDDPRERLDGIVAAIDASREELLGYDPPWMDPTYETMRSEVDKRLRQTQLAIAKLFEEASLAPTVPARSVS